MASVIRDTVPEDSLMKTHRGEAPQRWRGYSDCFTTQVDGAFSLGDFVFAFYTTPLFRVERLILRLCGAPSSDAQVRAVADGTGDVLAVWRVGQREPDQLLMCDRYQKTRSWFRVVPLADEVTLLQFGSAIATDEQAIPSTHRRRRSSGFQLLAGFHRVYSLMLLSAAARRLRGRPAGAL